MNRLFVLVLLVLFWAVNTFAVSYEPDKEKANVATPAAKGMRMPPKNSAVTMVNGKIEKIDASDRANIKVHIKDGASGSSRTVSVTPFTHITKVTDISELKTGDDVRVMIRKADDKEIAMGILFGKIGSLPPLKAMRSSPPPPRPAAKGKPGK